ncbi:MAG: peptide ABC transporter permease, partial [Planctomycetota bacterium]|nr:peptide ABC transporter permease [Planctomycetota bacterium]
MSGGGEPLVGRSLWQDAVRRLRKNKLAVFGTIYVLALLVACLVLPTILDWEAQHTHVKARLQPPSFSSNEITGRVHLCGTDELGRDLLARCFLGGQISFAVGIIATLVAVVIGTIYGAIAGYIGGRTDYIMMRVVDVLYGIPFMFIVIIILVVIGRGIVPIFFSLGI